MRILLIEDEKGVANFIRKGLEEESYRVDYSAEGNEGLSYALTGHYDLIILDIMLPGLNGIEVCRKIREKGVHTPVIMLTARDTVRDKVVGLDSGADDYMTKPFSFDEFLARVRALIRRKKDALTELKCGALTIDTVAHRVFVGSNEIVMRPKEYAILGYLLRNKGRVVSRTQILENVWGYDFDTNTNVVDVHIKSLRDKLGHYLPCQVIRSVRGTGYMIESLDKKSGKTDD